MNRVRYNYDYSHRGERILAKGISVSNDTRITGCNNNDMIIGPSGSGKTGGYIIPNLQNPDGSIIVSDTKGRLAKMFSEELKAKGYRVSVLDFVNPKKSVAYNPLKYIRRYSDGRVNEQDVSSFAAILHPVSQHIDIYWDLSARRYIAMLVGYVLETEFGDESKTTMKRVAEVHRLCRSGEGLKIMKSFSIKHPDSLTSKMLGALGDMSEVPKTWNCILDEVSNNLYLFDYEEFSPIFGKGKTYDLTKIAKEKTVFFLNVSDTDTSMDIFTNLFHSQVFHSLLSFADSKPDGVLPVPVRMILDDFAASTVIENFDKLISVIRSRELSVSVILQSISQLESIYSKPEASTIINNCDHILYLGGHDLDTADFMSAHANKPRNAIMCMPHTHAYLLTEGQPARLVERVKPYSTLIKNTKEEKKDKDIEEVR